MFKPAKELEALAKWGKHGSRITPVTVVPEKRCYIKKVDKTGKTRQILV